MKKIALIAILIILCMSELYSQVNIVNYTNKNEARSLAIENDTIWIGTTGGIIKRDLNGNLLKTITTADGLSYNFVTSVSVDSEGNKWFGTNNGVSKFDGQEWITFTTAEGLAGNSVNAIAIDTQGNVWFGTDCGVSKLIPSTVDIKQKVFSSKSPSLLSHSYPNPFSSIISISFSIPTEQKVELNIYNTKGNLVKTIISGKKEAGRHNFKFDGSHLSSGFYFYRLKTERSGVISRKILLLK